MDVYVKCFATLSGRTPQENTITLPDSSRVQDLLSALHIPREEVTVILVNQHPVDSETMLTAGDRISLIPTITGG